MPNTKLWTQVTPSEHVHERAALHFVRERFPFREPFRAWANFTFTAEDGTRNEVDLLVVSPSGVYLVEIKSHPGRMDGDAGTWIWSTPDGKRRTLDNPLILAERKAKKLKSLLMRQPALQHARFRHTGFYLRSAVFLSDPDLVVGLNEPGKTDVYGPDTNPQSASQSNDLPGLLRLFKHVDPHRGRQVDRPLSKAIADAVAAAGIRESTTHRKVGIYELGELLDEGEGWQDFAAIHPDHSQTHRRIRLYLAGEALDQGERDALVRAAEREFKFLQGIEHPGIDVPIELLQTARGPALVFRRDPTAIRLDHWLADHAEELDLVDRIGFVRQLGEALRHAHRQGLYHRALAPNHVSVVERPAGPVLQIRDWQSAARARSSGSSSGTGTHHVADRVSAQAHVYLAPETLSVPDPQAVTADIWSLGATAFLVLSGKPPAPDVDGLHAQLREQGCLSLATVMDAPASELDSIIREATYVDATERFVSVDEFLEFIDLALDDLTAPEHEDPLEASRGDTVGDGWEVIRRVGSGRSSVVLLVNIDGRDEVLKIARSDEHAARLVEEHEILTSLRDRSIVEPYGLVEFGGRTVLRLEPALGTLGGELHKNGALSLDLLERYGTDLLRAVAHLDSEGIAHRDIKPDNVGIAERGKDKERHLVLFDFSLSRTDPAEIRVGTLGYLDPFLEERVPRRWDQQAERYAIAVTLYEMATGKRPEWGDGSTDPLLTELELPTIESDLFDSSVRESLLEFFQRGLHRKPDQRFDTVEDMLRAWDHVFAGMAQHAVRETAVVYAAETDLTEVTVNTPLAALGLAPKVRNALDRLGASTVADLLDIPPAHLVRLSGIGAATRREINHLAQRVREEIADPTSLSNPDLASIDHIAEQLVPKPPADEDHRTAVAALLELADGPNVRWPAARDVVERAELGRGVVADALSSARSRWSRQPELTGVRNEIVSLLTQRGGIAGGDEIAGLLLTSRGSLAQDPLRGLRARAVVRAAAETEATLQEPRVMTRRLGRAFLLALDGRITVGGEDDEWDAELLTNAAAVLGEAAEELAGRQPLPTPEQVLRELRNLELPAEISSLTDARLVRLAASAAGDVAVSSRLELYPIGMDVESVLRESRALLLDRKGLRVGEIQDRIRARFPEAEPLPDRPELDALLAPLDLRWDDGRYKVPTRGGTLSTFVHSSSHTTSFGSLDERDAAVRTLDARLRSLRESGGFLALTVGGRRYAGAAAQVAGAVGGEHVNLDQLLLGALRDKADELGAKWDVILDADNKRGQQAWTRLHQLLDRTLPDVESELLAREGIVVATGLGLLARYERFGMLERLRDALTRGGGGRLEGLVLVVPGDDPSARPTVDGTPVPVITANHWSHIPGAWIEQSARGSAA